MRSIGFGAPFCNHKKNRDDLDRRMWKDMFLTVMNKDDPLPAMISATLDPKLLDNADNKVVLPVSVLASRPQSLHMSKRDFYDASGPDTSRHVVHPHASGPDASYDTSRRVVRCRTVSYGPDAS